MRLLSILLLVTACGDDASVAADGAPPDHPPDAPACATPRAPDPDPAVEALLQRLEAAMAAEHVPGLAYAVLKDGVVIEQRALGVRELGACEPFTASTRVRFGPALRGLDAIAVLQEVERGAITLDTPVASILPGFGVTQGDAAGVTIRRVLDHSAGLYLAGFDDACPSQDLVGYWSVPRAALEHAPGAAVGLWDEELSVQGAVIERLAGVPYRQAMRQRVLSPLGMSATFDHDEFLAGTHGRGTSPGGQILDREPCGVWEPTQQLYVDLADAIALARFLRQGNPAVLSAAMFDLMRSVDGKDFFVELRRGFGVQSLVYDGVTRMTFTDGAFDGTGAEIDVFDDGYAVVFLENAQSFTPAFTDAIIAARTPHTYVDPLRPLPAARLGEYSGEFVDALSSPPRTVKIDGPALTGRFEGQAFTLSPVGEDTFELAMFGATALVRFWRGANGEVALLNGDLDHLGPTFHKQ
ncbi:MAG: beta-lactamase family protein [Deltaproteobacteria bacterium]|nr:beta-lactamase family protein [Deltaproteobacteria bacterium]